MVPDKHLVKDCLIPENGSGDNTEKQNKTSFLKEETQEAMEGAKKKIFHFPLAEYQTSDNLHHSHPNIKHSS